MRQVYKIIFLFFTISSIHAQILLSKEEALSLTLENNFGILMTRNINEIAKNNSALLNTGYLPTISASGGANYNTSSSEIGFPGQQLEDGSPRPNLNLDNQETQRFNGGLNFNYTLLL